MPELPEVETVARGLAAVVTGLRVRRLEIYDCKLAVQPNQLPTNWVVYTISRIGKEVVIHLAPPRRHNPSRWLCVHLRMTGRLLWSESSDLSNHRHLRARITLNRGSILFLDSRRFGTLRILDNLENGFPRGVDPLSNEFAPGRLSALLEGSKQQLKPWLIRQDRLVGLGNLYASEICFLARLSPFRIAGELNWQEIERLHQVIRRLLARAIQYCGTTFSDFQDSRGRSGRFRRYLNVYDREAKQCRRCRTPIIRKVQQGRSTFYCPVCQGLLHPRQK